MRIGGLDIELWAQRRDAQAVLPELVRRLVLATAPRTTQVTFRSDEGVQVPGWDGVVENTEATPFVPEGTSGWELTVSEGTKRKAQTDYDKRSKAPDGLRPEDTTFVFITAHRWPQKAKWAQERKAEGRWRDVRVYDADDLATWLSQASAVESWFARLVGKRPPGTVDLDGLWEAWSHETWPPISEELIMAGRADACSRVRDWLCGSEAMLRIRAETREEVIAFFSAVARSLEETIRQRTLALAVVVRTDDALGDLALRHPPLILVLDLDSPDTGPAVRRGHRVILPLGRETAAGTDVLDLPPPDAQEVARVLERDGLPEDRARQLGILARRSVAALRRKLAVAPEAQHPAWATPEVGSELAPIILAGSWDGAREGDREALVELPGGRSYEELERRLVSLSERPDPPLRRVGEVWYVTAPEDAWQLLARYLTWDALERFQRVATKVLSSPDPRFELPPDGRYMAAVLRKTPRYSEHIVRGLAGTLAVMAKSAGSSQVAGMRPNDVVRAVVCDVLEKANGDWRAWATLSSFAVLQILAEAAPDEFLAAVERGLQGDDPVLSRLFTDQRSGIFASSPHPGLLWALEVLAWSPDHLTHVVILLGGLATVDPGGTLANRPQNTLREIFLPWYPQTAAPAARRLEALDCLRRRNPDVAWDLMVGLLPQGHDVQHPTARPRYRTWAPGEKPRVTEAEYWTFVSAIVSRLLEDAGRSGPRWAQVIEAVPNLSPQLRRKVVERLREIAAPSTSEKDRASIWHALRRLVSRHRSYRDAEWALPDTDIDELANLMAPFQPLDPRDRFGWLFGHRPELPQGLSASWDARRAEVGRQRIEALREVHAAGGLKAVFELTRGIKMPLELGRSLGALEMTASEEGEVLRHLASPDSALADLARGFAVARVTKRGPGWARERLTTAGAAWSPAQQAECLLALPAEPTTWDLAASLGAEAERRYWTRLLPYGIDEGHAERAMRAFIEHGNAVAAIHLAADWAAAPGPLLAEALERYLHTAGSTPFDASLGYRIGELLDRLQAASDVDRDRVAPLEWAYLPLLRFDRAPKVLHERLARDPEFFVELVSLVFRGEGEAPRNLAKHEEARARRAFELLQSWRTCPGERDGGDIDRDALFEWVEGARRLLQGARRGAIGDEMIGQVLSGSPSGPDGAWPHPAVRDLIEELASDDLERGIGVGLRNSRGAVTKTLDEGGAQERALADQYDKDAAAVAGRWPRTAALLRRMAESYRADAAREDERAQGRGELEE